MYIGNSCHHPAPWGIDRAVPSFLRIDFWVQYQNPSSLLPHSRRPLIEKNPSSRTPTTSSTSRNSSDTELFETRIEEPLSEKPPNSPRSVWDNFASPTPFSPERTSSASPIHEFSAGSAILDHTLNLVKTPDDKPRLFVRYTLDFKPRWNSLR